MGLGHKNADVGRFSAKPNNMMFRWTDDLKRKFVSAVMKYGDAESVFPKKIWLKMRVDGVTLSQVRSYLQKYRDKLRNKGIKIKVPEEANRKEHDYWIFKNLAKESSNKKEKRKKKSDLDLTLRLDVRNTSNIVHEGEILSLDLSL